MKTLLSEYPEISSEWHPTNNGELKPDKITYGSNKIVWWSCPNGHDYEYKIKLRTREVNPVGCQECKSLEFLFPEISKEWHPTKNGELKLEEKNYLW